MDVQMESIIALEELVKENEAKVTLQKRQLADHESGESKLSAMAQASTENSLEIASELLAKYKAMLDQLLAQDQAELEEKERVLAIATRKKYFDAQDSRIKLYKEKSNDQKLEVMRIIGELPTDVQFEDEELFEIATKSLELALPDAKELSQKLQGIQKEFQALKKSEDKNIQEMGTIDFLIPIIILHFHILFSNINENIDEINNKALQENQEILNKREEEKERLLNIILEQEKRLKAKENITPEDNDESSSAINTDDTKEINIELSEEESSSETSEEVEKPAEIEEPVEEIADVDIQQITKEIAEIDKQPIPEINEVKFAGFPKYQDWWIRELWSSHQAYFALFKWKSIINNLCMSTEQKKAWSIIFDRWVFIKKMLNDKGELAYNYTFAFDSLLATHAQTEEEIDKRNIISMENIVIEITKKEDFTTMAPFHDIDTPYLKFKQKNLLLKKQNQKE